MNVVFYSSGSTAGKRLCKTIEMLVSKTAIRVCHTVRALSRRLRQPLDDPTVVILMAGSKDDLARVLSLKELLWNVRIILILPDDDDVTIAMGHTLRPRFISFCDGDFVEVIAVLSRMTGKNETPCQVQTEENL